MQVTEEISDIHLHCSIIYNSQEAEATQMSINKWMDKENGYTHTMGYF